MASILLFDSGVGGLSIYQHLRQQLGEATVHYLADNARFPYGELETQTLIDGCVALVDAFVVRHQVKLVVIACNSASTLVLDQLRQRLAIPVVGVVPAIKPAAEQSQNKVIGLLATPGTVQRQYTEALIDTYAADCQVIRIGSSELVQMAESKLAGDPINLEQLQQLLAPFLQHSIQPDTIVLGCTHFPLLSAELQQVVGKKVNLVDSGAAVAKQILVRLKQHHITLDNGAGGHYFYTGAGPTTALVRYLKSVGLTENAQFVI